MTARRNDHHDPAKNKYRTIFHDKARDQLRGIDRDDAMRILHKLTELETNPYGYDTTPLVDRPDHRRLRVGSYRVIYTVDNGQLVVWVVEIGHRSVIYDR